MFNPHIGDEIFSRLPTKSVARFRCLSKAWNNQLSTSSFINSHLNRYKTHNQENLVFVTLFQSLKTITFPTKKDQVLREIHLSYQWPTFILGSCNGLVLLSCDNDIVVLNPTTGRTRLCPYTSNNTDDDNEDLYEIYGFGYDHSCDDYKVVALSYNRTERYAAIDVYSVRRNFSERVCYLPFDHTRPKNMVMPFVNDAVHWLTTIESSRIHIGAFDLINETFHEVPFPKELKPNVFFKLVILGGCLSIVNRFGKGITDVWIMKEYGVVDSWIKFRINVNGRWNTVTPVCFVGEHELLSFTERDSWVVCDLIDGTVKEVAGGVLPGSATFGDWGTFEDTLVSPAPSLSSRYAED